MDLPIAVVVTTYDDPHRLELCLEGLQQQTFKDFVVYIVDDGSSFDASQRNRQLAMKYIARLLYLDPPSPQFRAGAARNLALRHTSARRTLFVDGDCVLAPDVVGGHADYGNRPEVVCGARRHVPEAQVSQLTTSSVANLRQLPTTQDQRYRQHGGPYTAFARRLSQGVENLPLNSHKLAWGFQMSVPTARAKALGGFDESFVGYGGEDQEFASRLQRSGCQLVGRMDFIAYHLDHPQRSGDWHDRVAASLRNPNLVRNEQEAHTQRPDAGGPPT